jgi:hypothetical protein
VTTTTIPDLRLHRIPPALVPREPRLGGSCVPVPGVRFTALTRSGSAVIGLPPAYGHVAGFVASVHKELRDVLRLPATHDCVVVPAPVEFVSDLVATGPWATTPIVARENPGWRTEPDNWRVVDLTRMSTPRTSDVLGEWDVAVFCAGRLFGLPTGLTVVTLSPRAVAAGRFLDARFALSITDLVMLAHAVRAAAEAEPGALERAVRERFALVHEWAAGLPWVTGPPIHAAEDLVALVPTALAPPVFRAIGDFLVSHHLAYGVADDSSPGSFQIGLFETIPVDDLTRLLGLLGHLVDTVTG